MGHIFISYSRNDKKEVEQLESYLEKKGHNVWLDTKDIEGGDQWRGAIVKAIKAGHALIVAISQHSVSSKNVRKELDVAEQASVRIIPVRLSQAAIPDELSYQLAGIQEIDLSGNLKDGLARLSSVLGEDAKVKEEARGRGIKRRILWAVGGGIVGWMFVWVTKLGLPWIGPIIGAVLGLAFSLGLIGWISHLITWAAVLLGGGVAGSFVASKLNSMDGTHDPSGVVIPAVAGAFLAVIFVLVMKRRWKSRKRAKIAALAKEPKADGVAGPELSLDS
jgi:hypothetical protein